MARPRRPDPNLARADAAYRAGDFATALTAYEAAARRDPRNGELLHRMGRCLGQLGRFDRAADVLKRAARARPSAIVHTDCAVALQHAGRFDAAHRAYDLALRVEPGNPFALAKKANLHVMQGDAPRAVALLEPHVDDAPAAPVADVFGRAAAIVGRRTEGIAVLGRSLEAAGTDAARADLLFRLASLLDGEARYDEAFQHAQAANALRRAQHAFDADAHAATIDRRIATWTADRHADAPRARNDDERLILIVGMPRSGTSLVEQVLAAHPSGHGAGELVALSRIARAADGDDVLTTATEAELTRLGAAYSSELSRGAGSALRISDKMPANFLHLGLADLTMPRARVVHCMRDPLDTCVSCFMQNFGAPNPYSHDLADLGAYYVAYRRLVDHWRAVIDLPILDISYEALVSDPEPHIRDLVAFAGLEWDDACLRPHEADRVTLTASNEQVRRPIYRGSAGRHARYDAHLGPLRAALDRASSGEKRDFDR